MLSSSAQFPAESTLPPAAACPAPDIDTRTWQAVILDNVGVRFKLPKKYREVIVNNAINHLFETESFDRIAFDVRPAPDNNLDHSKTGRQDYYEGFTECREIIGGREAILQSYRGGGAALSSDGQRFRAYNAYGVWQLKPGQVLHISGNLMSRAAQEELLAIFRTVEFIR